MDETHHSRRREDRLLNMLVETIQGLEAVRCFRDEGMVGKRRCTAEEPCVGEGGQADPGSEERTVNPPGSERREEGVRGGGGSAEEDEGKEKECKQKILGVLRELSVAHADGVSAWRETLSASACMFTSSPPGGNDDQQLPPVTDNSEPKVKPFLDPFNNTLQSIVEDIETIMDRLNAIISKLDTELIRLCAEESSAVDADTEPDIKQPDSAALEETRNSPNSVTPEDTSRHSDCHDPLGSGSGHKQGVYDGGDQGYTKPSQDVHKPLDIERTSDSSFGSSDCSDGAEMGPGLEVQEGQVTDNQCVSPESQTNFLEETEKDREREEAKGKEETNTQWVTMGLTGQLEDSQSVEPHACYITAPAGVSEAVKCEVADTLSSLMVIGSEELVSRVIRVTVQDGANFHFPVTVVVPFRARYRGNYRDVVVKVVDGEKRASYILPITTEGTYGGRRGSFAEVRVYSLGLFAVVSRLRRESYTVPRRGSSLKLPMDPRICLDYLPGSFTAAVIAQAMIQPLDAGLLAALKSRNDAYYPVVSASPLLYLAHPSSQPLRRPLTVTLPCPPNPETKRAGQAEESQHYNIRPASTSSLWDQPTSRKTRMLRAAVKSSKEISNEVLVLLGSRDKQWDVLDKVAVRNLQNGLVSFELTEHFDRLLVVRLLSPVQPCHLASLAEELEESACRHTVTVVLQRRREDPHAVLVAALPSRDLNWELAKLRTQGYSGLPETTSEISMCEGDQLLLRFSGNITSTGLQNNQNGSTCERITFHSQQRNHLLLHLTEVDSFGNYSSPHYKGTAVFYKVARGCLEWQSDNSAPLNAKLPGDPICKLPLTLPKKVRAINRPVRAKVKLCEETESLSDSLLLWLSGELSEEEIALLVLSLRLRRSAAQLVRLRAGNSLSAQAFHLLTLWRRGLPAAPHPAKASQLAHCLSKSGRPDLARELLLRQAAATREASLK